MLFYVIKTVLYAFKYDPFCELPMYSNLIISCSHLLTPAPLINVLAYLWTRARFCR